VSPNTPAVQSTFLQVRQSLPAVDSLEAFVASHQTSIAQLAIQYCSALVDNPGTYFGSLDLNGAPNAVFGGAGPSAGKDALIDPLIRNMVTDATSSPTAADLKNSYDPTNGGTVTPPADEGNDPRPGLYELIDTLNTCNGACPASRTKLIAKATCGAVLGSGAVLID
jgi:hypothetical protein